MDRIKRLMQLGKATPENVEEWYDLLFADWVKDLNLEILEIGEGFVLARLPQNKALQWASGAICGQTLMAAIDTVMSIAMTTTDLPPSGTASQTNEFINPAIDDDLIIESIVTKFGRTVSFGRSTVKKEKSNELVCQSSSTYAMTLYSLSMCWPGRHLVH